jgi:hypothetical protein
MPNDCWSEVFFHGSTETIKTLLLTHLDYASLFAETPTAESKRVNLLSTPAHQDQTFSPSKESQSVESFHVRHLYHTKTTVMFKLWSPWKPPFEFLEKLSQKFPELFIRCIWEEEGGEGGAWVRSKENGVQQLSWVGPCLEACVYE